MIERDLAAASGRAAHAVPGLGDPAAPISEHVATELVSLLAELGTVSSDLVRGRGPQIGGALDDHLGSIGQLTRADRVAVFAIDDRHFRAECLHEWCGVGIPSFRAQSSLIELADFAWPVEELETLDHHLDTGRVAAAFSMGAVLAIPVVANGRLASVLTLQWLDRDHRIEIALLPALRLFAQQLHLLSSHNRLRERASIDDLTGLANKKLMLVTLNRMLSRLKRAKVTGLSVLLCELEGVRDLAAATDRVSGDRALASVARVLENATREGDLVGRFNDVVFVVLCEDVPTAGEAVRIGERLRATMLGGLAEISEESFGQRSFEVSVGVAHATRDGNSGVLLRQADTALYRARRGDAERVQLVIE